MQLSSAGRPGRLPPGGRPVTLIIPLDLREHQENSTEGAGAMTTRHIRRHSTDHMSGLGELSGITDPVAVVIRPDGSLDVYGCVGIVDQQTGNDRPYTWIVGRNLHLHEHRCQGQTLRHSHPDGERDHGYYEHPEDAGSR